MRIFTATLPLRTPINHTYSLPNLGSINLRKIFSRGENAKLEDFKDFVYQYGRYLDLDYKAAKELLFGKNDKRIEFFKQIATRYNLQKHKTQAEAESPNFALNIFKKIKDPHKEHFFILNNFSGSFEMLEKLFSLASDKKTLEFLHNFSKENYYRGLEHKTQIATDMLDSPNKTRYMERPEEFISYLKLHAKDENAIKRLDNLIKTGEYKTSKYDVKRAYLKLSANKFLGSEKVINENALNEHYTPEGLNLLKVIFYDFTRYGEKLTDRNLEEILRIYNTTNSKNSKLREAIVHKFRFSADNIMAKEIEHEELVALRELFEKANSDVHVHNFLQKTLKKGMKLEYIQELNDILKVVPAKKADLFFDNIRGIVSVVKGKERYDALLNELENPFYVNEILYDRYESKGHIPFSQDTQIGKAKKYLLTKMNTYRYRFSNANPKHTETQIPPSMKKNTKPVKKKVSIPASMKRFDTFYTGTFRNVQIPQNYSLVPQTNQDVLKSTLRKLEESIKIAEDNKALELKKQFKEMRKQAKLKVISDIKDIVAKKLSKKTYTKQEATYEKKASKMKLALLPEIFESIKITRETDRLAGWKESVSTKDALKLYERINGNNKKLVRYMLLKQNPNGTGRKFSIKDIIRDLDTIEQKVIAKKAIDKNYKAKTDYDEIYNKYVEECGKPEPAPRKKKSVAKKKISTKKK